MTRDYADLTARQKAAILLCKLPSESSRPLLKALGEQETSQLMLELSRMPEVSPQVRIQVIEEYLHLTSANLDAIVTKSGQSNAGEVFEQLARKNPDETAKLLKSSWLNLPAAQNPTDQTPLTRPTGRRRSRHQTCPNCSEIFIEADEFQKHTTNCQTPPPAATRKRTTMRTGSRMRTSVYPSLPPVQDITGPTGHLLSPNGHLPLKAMAIKATITGLLYQTTVTQTYCNQHDAHLEATYIFPLPPRAAVAGYTMTIGQEVVQGVLKERGQAQQDYQQALTEGRRSSLAEQERPDLFSVRVGNIAPQESIIIELQLEGPLAFEGLEACFRFPLVVGPRYIPGQPLDGPQAGPGIQLDTTQVPDASRISPPILLEGHPNPVELTIQVDVNPAGIPLNGLQSSLHQTAFSQTETGYRLDLVESERLDRDFILRLQLQPTNHLLIGPDLSFMLTVVPPPGPENRPGRDIVILLDRSGSMDGWKMTAAIQAAIEIIEHLSPRDRFGLVLFDDSVEDGPNATLQPAYDQHKFEACSFLKTVRSKGGTNMLRAFQHAGKYLQTMAGDRSLVLITDGEVGNHDQLLAWSAQQSQTRLFVVGIDEAPSQALLKQLASQSGGLCRLVESQEKLAQALTELQRAVVQPILQNLEILPSPNWISPRRWDVFPEHPGLFFGQFPESMSSGKLVLRAMLPDGSVWSESLSRNYIESSLVSKSWARSRILDLEDDWSSNSDNDKELIELSLKHQVLSRFTAFVAVHSQVQETSETLHRVLQPVEPIRSRLHRHSNLGADTLGHQECRTGPSNSNRGSGPSAAEQLLERQLILESRQSGKFAVSSPIPTLWDELIDGISSLLESKQNDKLAQIVRDFGHKMSHELSDTTPKAKKVYFEINPILVEVGRGLMSLVDPKQGAKLLERVTAIRTHFGEELGVILPGVRFRDNIQLEATAFRILLRDNEVARGKVHPEQFLFIGPQAKLEKITGTLTTDPTFGMPAKWLMPSQRQEAEQLGCIGYDACSVIAVHLTEAIREYAAELLTFDCAEAMLDQPHVKTLSSQLLARGIDRFVIWQVLRQLLAERVSIRDLDAVLAGIGDHHHLTTDPLELVELVRSSLARQISSRAANAQKIIHAIVLGPKLERQLQHTTEFTTKMSAAIREGIALQLAAAAEKSIEPVLLVPAPLRRPMRTLLIRKFPRLKVLSWNEIAPGYEIETTATLTS
jgi:Ca-activated chloride channel homolog